MKPHSKPAPPAIILRFFRWFCHPQLQNHIEGDLMELYHERFQQEGKRNADLKFTLDVVLLCRQEIIRDSEKYRNINRYGMYKSYFKIGWRNLLKNKGYSFINIGGLALAIPLSYYILYSGLKNYEYRTTIGWQIFAMTAVGALAITILTVSFQAIKAALANPVKSLKEE